MLRVQRVGPTSTTTVYAGPRSGPGVPRPGPWTGTPSSARAPGRTGRPGGPDRPEGAPEHMSADNIDPSAARESTDTEAPAEAASDAPTGSPRQPHPTPPDGFGDLDRRTSDTIRVL